MTALRAALGAKSKVLFTGKVEAVGEVLLVSEGSDARWRVRKGGGEWGKLTENERTTLAYWLARDLSELREAARAVHVAYMKSASTEMGQAIEDMAALLPTPEATP